MNNFREKRDNLTLDNTPHCVIKNCHNHVTLPMLQVDHIDGNPYNEPEDGSNFQTLCACCHLYKTWQSGDNKTAGRKTLKMPKVVLE